MIKYILTLCIFLVCYVSVNILQCTDTELITDLRKLGCEDSAG